MHNQPDAEAPQFDASPTHSSLLARCRIVLVRPKIAANIGAAARAMRNFGASQLTVVSPDAEVQDPRAKLLATHAQVILDNARIVNDLSEAVADCLIVACTSARTGGLFRRQSVGSPQEITPHLVQAMSLGHVALVFGPESSGLTDSEVTRCHYLIHIPAEPQHPALNLAQAIAITLYELHQECSRQRPDAPAHNDAAIAAPFALQERMFVRLREAMEAIHFLHGEKTDALMHGIRHLLGKARLTKMEVKLLFGLARQMKWIARHATTPATFSTTALD